MTQIFNILSVKMQALDTFLALLARTEGRDKFLRLIQYACLHSVEHEKKGPAYNIYGQMRMVRKLLRFLRSLQYSTKVKQQAPQLKKNLHNHSVFLQHLTSILQNLFTVLFYLSDHRVCLGELGIISKETMMLHYPRSMKFYFLQNVMGVINNLIKMAHIIQQNQQNSAQENSVKAIKRLAFDLLRCLLDCLVGLFYWKKKLPASRVGVIGVISSIMAIIQSLKMI